MPDDYLEASGELESLKLPKKKKKHPFRIVIDILLIVVFAIVIAISANVIYLSVAFGEGFFVNGASMYPTLNKVGYTWVDGTRRNLTWLDSYNYAKGDNVRGKSLSEGDYVDYGYGYSKEGFLKNIKRMDIVMTYYPSDYSDLSTHTLNKNASLKIKRIIGLPNETVNVEKVEQSATNKDWVWGKTTIKGPNDKEPWVLPNLYTIDDFPAINSKKYPYGGSFISKTLTLGADEYFICGDNRYHSQDSRAIGAIKDFMIKGQACLVTGLRQLERDKDGNIYPKFKLDAVRFPWQYTDLRQK